MTGTESNDYKPGDVVNGHQLSADGTTWEAISLTQPAAPDPRTRKPDEREGNWFARHKTLSIVGGGIAAFLLIAGVASGGGSSTENPSETTAAAEQPMDEDDAATSSEGTQSPETDPPAAEPLVQDEPETTLAQDNALRAAESYLDSMPFSKRGLIDQLSSEYGSGYKAKEATWAVNQLDVDWNEQAVLQAKSYLDTMAFSRAGLIDQLSSEYGSQFTVQQATYAVDQIGL